MSLTTSKYLFREGGKLSIGALARATGIPVETLRTWERRYGFPVPERKPSGHRVYPISSVPRLHRIAEALARGHRASETVAASETELSALLDIALATPLAMPVGLRGEKDDSAIASLLQLVASFDAVRLTQSLLADQQHLGTLDFLRERVAPLIHAVGEEWAAARFEIRHEHFLSEKVGDLLRSLRLPLEEKAQGPLIICASLPGEAHALGLQMAALLLATVGCRVLFLGTEVPPAQLASLARDLNARAVALSVSISNRGEPMASQVTFLRGLLPRRVSLLVGGSGAPGARPGLKSITEFSELEAWGRRLVNEA